ncbi:MAG: hypothetical protein ACYC5Q_05360 [Thermoleophilia bacterium]
MSSLPEAMSGADLGDSAPPDRWRRAPLVLVGVGLTVVVAALVLVPPDKVLGDNVRLVFFHGAVTWTGIVTTVLAGLLGLGHLALGRPGASSLWRSLSLAAFFWTLSLTISFPVMRSTWGGVVWNEPKLLMSAEVVSTLLMAWAVSLLVGRSRVTAALAVVAALVMVALLVVTPGAFHPDNPIMSSGDIRFVGSFAALVGGLLCVTGGIITAGRERVRRSSTAC